MLPNSGEDGRLTIRFWSDLFNSSMDFGAQFDFLCVGGGCQNLLPSKECLHKFSDCTDLRLSDYYIWTVSSKWSPVIGRYR